MKPSGRRSPDAGYGLTRADYVRLVATMPTITKAIPMRIIPAVEFHNKNRKIREAGRNHAGLRGGYSALGRTRGRFLSDADIETERNYCVLAAEVAEEAAFRFGEPIGQEVMVNRTFYGVVGVMKPRMESAGIGGSLAAESFTSDIYVPIFDVVAPQRGHDRFDQAGAVSARHQ